jgi:hypothetical protein
MNMATSVLNSIREDGCQLLAPSKAVLYIDVKTPLSEIRRRIATLSLGQFAALALLFSSALVSAQSAADSTSPPPSTGGFFPLSDVRRGMTATAWTVFTGTKPEPMQVEILGVLRGERGPGQDMILAQLHGTKPEYTGVVAGMSGSPVYIGNKLLGSLSYRIGQFSKDPIAGITPIEQMLEVRDLPIPSLQSQTRSPAPLSIQSATSTNAKPSSEMDFHAIETPLVLSGFHPEAIRMWQQQMAGTGLEMVAAGGMGGASKPEPVGSSRDTQMAAAWASVVPGSAVSAQLMRGDLEIAATCTVTYIDPKQLLACGHPILQAGTVSLPMTTTEVVATLASPLNAFKIINTGDPIGAFTEDRESAIRGVFGEKPRMIPVHIAVHGPGTDRNLNFEVLDMPSLTPQAVQVGVYEALLESNENTNDASYHLTGTVVLDGHPSSALDMWASSGGGLPSALGVATLAAERFSRIYSNGTRLGSVRGIDLHIEAIPKRVQVELESARLVSNDIVHAGDTVMVEATIRPWQQAPHNLRIPFKLPARLASGNLRLLVSDSGTLDRTLDQPRFSTRQPDLESVLAQAANQHPADRIYLTLLVPETQAGIGGQTLGSLPLSMANVLEPIRTAQDIDMNGESAEIAGDAPAGGVLTGFQILNLRVEPGGGLD